MRPPDFWSDAENVPARVLEPIGRIVGAVTTWRAGKTNQPRAPIPVISVGGVTVGGSGKTPIADSIAALLREQGEQPAILLRGYGGKLKTATRVDLDVHTPEDVGDEALLHARTFPTWVARSRLDAAQAAAAAGMTVAVLDDGHQHPGLHKDLSFLVIDGRDPFGNGLIFPAGPLRESPDAAARRAQAVVIVGEDVTGLAARIPTGLAILRARLVPGPEAAALKKQRVVAFAGIGNPKKFFRTLEEIGARVVARHRFEDHHRFDLADIQPILDEAFAVGAIPVTTTKDAMRLPADQRQQVNVLSIEVQWEDRDSLLPLLADVRR